MEKQDKNLMLMIMFYILIKFIIVVVVVKCMDFSHLHNSLGK